MTVSGWSGWRGGGGEVAGVGARGMWAVGKSSVSRGRARRKRVVRVERLCAWEAGMASAAAVSARRGGAGGWVGEGRMMDAGEASMDGVGGWMVARASGG